MTRKGIGYCAACGGEGWLPSLPEGRSECPYCKGTGKPGEPLPRVKPEPKPGEVKR